MQVIDSRRPLHVSIVGGEPLVRYRELNEILPILAARNIHTQLVTSAVRPIPLAWARLRRLQVVVSVDGFRLNTINGAHRRPTREFSNTSRATKSRFTAP
jgi:organic radical activating enzyme